MKSSLLLRTLLSSLLANSAIGQNRSEDVEPILSPLNASTLIQEASFEGWEVPSEEHWSIVDGTIVGDTKGLKLTVPQWLYTEGTWSDFIFTIEAKITGAGPNSGVYFRARKINWKNRYEAATGYEYDFAEGSFNGSVGDFFSRPRFRILADDNVIEQIYKVDDWNRLTIRVRENRVEYWMNGTKIQDLEDPDTNASREGIIGLQLHDKIVMKAEFRNAYVLDLEGDMDAPPRIVPRSMNYDVGGSELSFTLKGVSGKSYRILATNQIEAERSNWFEVGVTGSLIGNTVTITDSTANLGKRFYLAHEMPER